MFAAAVTEFVFPARVSLAFFLFLVRGRRRGGFSINFPALAPMVAAAFAAARIAEINRPEEEEDEQNDPNSYNQKELPHGPYARFRQSNVVFKERQNRQGKPRSNHPHSFPIPSLSSSIAVSALMLSRCMR